jgi:hypothetical protein
MPDTAFQTQRSDTPLPDTALPRWRLWHRASGRHKWRVVAAGEWGPDVLRAMDGVHNGEWMMIDDNHDPNEKGTA